MEQGHHSAVVVDCGVDAPPVSMSLANSSGTSLRRIAAATVATIGQPNELHGIRCRRLEQRVARSPVAIFGLADRAGIHEPDAIDQFRVRLVGVPVHDDVGIR